MKSKKLQEKAIFNNGASMVKPRQHHHSPVFAIVLIVAGLLLLLTNLQIVSWNVWMVIWKFWPVIFILFGLRLIFGFSKALRITLEILTVLIVAIIVVISIASVDQPFRAYINKQLPQMQNVYPLITPPIPHNTPKKR